MSFEKERRTAGGPRIPIKTLVEIGAGEGGSAAFEAESINVTTSGMQLRTAYLPEIGEPLACRFEAGSKEVVVQGVVAWRKEEACGGDFGVRFSEVDQQSLQALRELAGESSEDESEDADDGAPPPARVQRGTRVRLHIEGLASPMKARVRDATAAEVMVGSNLEFLKVGRPLDLENIDAADKREARIERVNIEVDPSSHIPQLIVTLRYLDAPEAQPEDKCMQDPAQPDRLAAMAPHTSETRWADDEQGCEEDSDEDLARKAGKPEALWNRLRQVGPTLAAFGGRAKDVVNHALDKARSRTKTDDETALPAPRRTTSPPPAGGLKAEGRKLVREENVDEDDAPQPAGLRKIPKRAVFIGIAAFITLFAVIALARKSSSPSTAAISPEGAASAAMAAAAESAAPAAAGGALVANVPLFGPTPMTTNEPAALPGAQAGANAAAPLPASGDKLAAEAAAAAPPPETAAAADDADSSGDSDGSDNASASAAKNDPKTGRGPKSFVHGKVRNPVVLSLRMTDKVRSVRGVPTPTGFTVHLAGCQSKDPAAGLAHRDPRIASIKVSNKGNGSDLTVQFKDGVPAYAVRASGSNLQIAIGRGSDNADSADKKSAKAEKHHPRKAAKHGKH
jgi:hypothetical protein